MAQKSSVPALNPALAAEQAAYQALLKLRAREFEVIRRNSRQQRQGGRNSGGNRSRRQLQQLELTDEENRYEDQRTARAQQERLSQREQEQRETGQVLNRLRELAQRQNDVNDRLKELQSALEAAKTPARRARKSSGSSRGSGTSSNKSSAIPMSSENGWSAKRTETEWPTLASRSTRAVSTSVKHPRRSKQGRIPQALTEGGPSGPAIQRPARRAAQGGREPLLGGNDRDARPGAASRRESEETLRAA